MKTLVIDTSVIIKWINKDNEINSEKADIILDDVKNNKIELIVPELCKYEVGNVLFYGKKLNPKDASIAFKAFYSLPITFISESEELARETYNFAFNCRITYYDASFMSLAKQYNATLVTDNIKHQGKPTDITVKSLAEY